MSEAFERAREIFERALPIYTKNWKELVMTVAVVMLPIAIFTAVISAGISYVGQSTVERAEVASMEQREDLQSLAARIEAAEAGSEEVDAEIAEIAGNSEGMLSDFASGLLFMFGGIGFLIFIVTPLSMVGTVLAEGALVNQVDALLGGQDALSPKEAWNSMKERWMPLLSTSLLVSAAVILGLICFVLPGLYLAWRMILVGPVVVLEGKSGTDAMRRSWSLVGEAKHEFLIVLSAFFLCSAAAGWVAGWFLPYSMQQFGGAVINILLLPLPVLGVTILYRSITQQQATPIPAAAREPVA